MLTTYKILFWQEIPSQIKAEDEREEITCPSRRASWSASINSRRNAACRVPTTISRSGSGATSSSARARRQTSRRPSRLELEAKADW